MSISGGNGFWDWMSALVGAGVSKLAVVTATVTALVACVNGVSGLISTLAARALGTLVTSASADVAPYFATLSDWLALVNSFVPLAEAFSLLTAWAAVWSACAVYRLVKSWIPTVS